MPCLCTFCPCTNRGVFIRSSWHKRDFNFLGKFVTDGRHRINCLVDKKIGRGNFTAEMEKVNILLAKPADNTACVTCIWYALSIFLFEHLYGDGPYSWRRAQLSRLHGHLKICSIYPGYICAMYQLRLSPLATFQQMSRWSIASGIGVESLPCPATLEIASLKPQSDDWNYRCRVYVDVLHYTWMYEYMYVCGLYIRAC